MPLFLERRPSKFLDYSNSILENVDVSCLSERTGLAQILLDNSGPEYLRAIPMTSFFGDQAKPEDEQNKIVGDRIKSLDEWYKYVPHFLERKSRNIIDTVLGAYYHHAGSLIEESALLNRTENIDTSLLSMLLSKQLALREFIEAVPSLLFEDNNKCNIVSTDSNRNKAELDFISHKLVERGEGVYSDASFLYTLQPKIWEMLTSNDMVVSADYNYRAKVNGLPGTHHSLLVPPQYPDYYHVTSYGSYQPFIEATSAADFAGMSTTFGFLHLVIVGEDGLAFQVEFPHVMIADEILEIDSTLISEIVQTEINFYRNHDLWHNLIPVHADHFILHHVDAPISLGGKSQDYLNFGRDMRFAKEEYEIGVSMAHSRTQIDMGRENPAYRESQFAILYRALDNVKLLQDELIETRDIDFADKVAEHLATLYVSRALNVYPPSSDEYRIVEQKLAALNLRPIEVKLSSVINLAISQGMIENTHLKRFGLDGKQDYDFDAKLNSLTFDEIKELAALVDIHNPNRESGSEYVFVALEEIGLWPPDYEIKNLSGMTKCRWSTIMMPQRRQIRGFAEKVHNKNGIFFGTNKEEVDPYVLLVKQTESLLERDVDLYQKRIIGVQLNQLLCRSLFQIILRDSTTNSQPIYDYLRSKIEASEVDNHCYINLIRIVDSMIHDLCTHKYSGINKGDRDMYNTVTVDLPEAMSRTMQNHLLLYETLCATNRRMMGSVSYAESRRRSLSDVMELSN